MFHKDIDADLIGNTQVEVGGLDGVVADEFRLGRRVGGKQRDGPWPLVDAAAPNVRELLSRFDIAACGAGLTVTHGPKLWVFLAAAMSFFVAEGRADELAEVVQGLTVFCEIAPEVAAGRLVDVGDILHQRESG